MALSGTVAFRPDVEEITAEAFERCGIDAQTRTGGQAVSARRSLNMLFSEFANRGINYWAVTQNTLTLVNASTYSMVYWAVNQLDDITAANQDTDVPYRWSDCISAGVAAKIAIKYAPDRFQLLNELYERSFNFAASSDNDGVSLRIQPTALNLT